MFGNKKNDDKKVEKLSGPREIPGVVLNYLSKELKLDIELMRLLKSTVRRKGNEVRAFDIKIFDEGDAAAYKIQVKDFTTLDAHPELVLWEGWFDEGTKKVELVEKKKFVQDVTLFSADEIQKKIEALTDQDSSAFFYMARGPATGGPLGRGSTVVELAQQVPGKKSKKYLVYAADVIDMKPAGKGEKLFDSDKSKDIAKWIKEAHHKRLY